MEPKAAHTRKPRKPIRKKWHKYRFTQKQKNYKENPKNTAKFCSCSGDSRRRAIHQFVQRQLRQLLVTSRLGARRTMDTGQRTPNTGQIRAAVCRHRSFVTNFESNQRESPVFGAVTAAPHQLGVSLWPVAGLFGS